MSKYNFDPQRLMAALSVIRVTADTLGENYSLGNALDDLILDIEDLHRRAVERDDLIDALWDAPAHERSYSEYVELEDIREILRPYMGRKDVAELNL